MPVSNADLLVYQGDDHAWTITVRNQDGTSAVITGYTAKAQIRRSACDPVVVAEMSAVVQSPLVQLALTHDQSATMYGRYVWDVQITSAAGAVTTIVAGKVQTTAEVTRANPVVSEEPEAVAV